MSLRPLTQDCFACCIVCLQCCKKSNLNKDNPLICLFIKPKDVCLNIVPPPSANVIHCLQVLLVEPGETALSQEFVKFREILTSFNICGTKAKLNRFCDCALWKKTVVLHAC